MRYNWPRCNRWVVLICGNRHWTDGVNCRPGSTREVRNLQAGLKAGYSAPKAAVKRVISQLDGVLAIAAEDSPFASPAQRDEDEQFSAKFVYLVSKRHLAGGKAFTVISWLKSTWRRRGPNFQ